MCFVCVSKAYDESANGVSGHNHIHVNTNTFDNSVLSLTGNSVFGTITNGGGITEPTDPTTINADIPTILSGQHWSGSIGEGANVTYSFVSSTADPLLTVGTGVTSFNIAQQQVTKTAFNDISQIIDVTFSEASNPTDADIHFYISDMPGNIAGLATYFFSGSRITDMTVGMDVSAQGFTQVGSWEYSTLLHEIGHALGLKHPGNYSGNEDGPFLDASKDNEDYTVMSYNSGASPATEFQELDVAALQYLYGAADGAPTTPTDDTSNDANSGSDNLSGTDGADDIKGGLGTDTVTGGAGNDTLYGGRAIADTEDDPDVVSGGTGNDLIYGNAGGDTIYGGDSATSTGDGNDTVYGGLGEDLIYGGAGDDSLAGGGGIAHPNDQLDTIYGGAGNDSIVANGGNDIIYGDDGTGSSGTDGNDTIYGGLGDDEIYGGGGDDFIHGQFGNERLSGGEGADIFRFYNDDGTDTITDFVAGTDTIQFGNNINGTGIMNAAEAFAALSATSGANVTLDLGSGNTVRFENLTGTLSASDFDIL